ncbi:hypothetical protein F5148DRAFT_1279864 [Russula earlei]|uniref:Uncharacterized protein n=1 Tax=Russula earlei TaxID=71964 RepID=A0ACC0ULE8_9AGAM|nr:hypothetical protein F5148DRAFT_1279864 [Russula earlei]
MTVDTIELRKMQYAQELAAHTMRQWMLVREALERKQGFAPASADVVAISRTQSPRPRSSRQTRDSSSISNCDAIPPLVTRPSLA